LFPSANKLRQGRLLNGVDFEQSKVVLEFFYEQSGAYSIVLETQRE